MKILLFLCKIYRIGEKTRVSGDNLPVLKILAFSQINSENFQGGKYRAAYFLNK